ncbi:hypothetical protein [uncultured Streptomyces sp.]|uniref:hypothetical protein n=1 Tax=uncultured Streptomyces sp. TaxID=174707 RepID=UPI00260B0F11|nr:hypothetical protein [uncultured Streptomyces sp.]
MSDVGFSAREAEYEGVGGVAPGVEFSARGVRIERWARSLTRAGQVVVKDGRLALLTSNGREIDSAPVHTVSTGRRWFFSTADSIVARVNGVRYRLTMGQRGRRRDGVAPLRHFLEVLRSARGLPERSAAGPETAR